MDRSPASRRRVSEQPLQYPCRWHTQWMRKSKKKQKRRGEGEAEEEEDASESYDFGGRRILLAEDTEMNAEIVTELLELVNMHVDHAWNGEEAVERYMESAPGTYIWQS